MNDDFGTPEACAVLFEMVREITRLQEVVSLKLQHTQHIGQLLEARCQTGSCLQSDHGPALVQRINACRAGLEQHRRNNFTGAMLRHHQHKSTQYMSQWIEAKNSAKPLTS